MSSAFSKQSWGSNYFQTSFVDEPAVSPSLLEKEAIGAD